MESRQTIIENSDYLLSLGIVIPNKKTFKNKGFIKLFPEDFIVEEITKEGVLVNINSEQEGLIQDENIKQNFKATLIQINTGTLEVVKKISKRLNVPETNIQYAGIKDNDAMTAQKITIQGVTLRELKSINCDSYYLKNIEKSDTKLRIGELSGNKFTVLVRFNEQDTDKQDLESKIKNIQENGFYNFYYSQRFGTMGRDNNHILGRLVLQQKYSEALYVFLTSPPKTCFKSMLPVFKEIRENYRDWEKIESILKKNPENFEKELSMIEYLIKNPDDHLGAIVGEIRFWVLGFASWLFNIKLSGFIIQNKGVPDKIDLVTSRNNRVVESYKAELELVELKDFSLKNMEKFNIQRATFPVDTKKQVVIENINFVKQGVILEFRLDKGSYATSVLAHCIDLIVGEIPENFPKEK